MHFVRKVFMIRSLKYLLTILVIILCVCQSVFATIFYKTEYGIKCAEENQIYVKSKWIEYDYDGDGLKEYYYFNSDGFMVKNATTPDGYTVNDKGQWVVDGVVMHEGAQSNEVSGDELSKQPAVEEKPSEETESDTASKEPLADNSVNSSNLANTNSLDVTSLQNNIDALKIMGANNFAILKQVYGNDYSWKVSADNSVLEIEYGPLVTPNISKAIFGKFDWEKVDRNTKIREVANVDTFSSISKVNQVLNFPSSIISRILHTSANDGMQEVVSGNITLMWSVRISGEKALYLDLTYIK